MDHLEKTAKDYRQNVSCFCFLCFVGSFMLDRRGQNMISIFWSLIFFQAVYPAKICGIIQESDTVKRLRISVHPDFTFKAGQW